MNSATAYTALETLLLFQSLQVFGTEPNVFAQISNILKNNVLIRESAGYDPGRLSPDALRELYLQLLREELRAELEAELPNDASPSRKRKIQPPQLPTLSDAKTYNHKLPQLVDRLYSRYKEYMIRLIRDDDARYAKTKQEIDEINRGEWDNRILEEERRKNRPTSEDLRRSVPRTSVQPERPVSREANLQKLASPSPAPSPRPESRSEGLAISDVLNSNEPPPVPSQSEKDSIARLKNGVQTLPPITHHRTSSTDRPHGPSPLQGQRPPQQQQPERIWENYQAPPTQQQAPQNHGLPPPFPPPQQYSHNQYPMRAPFNGSLPAPHNQLPPSPRAPHNPIVLPPLTGHRPGSPAGPLDQLADMAEQQQYRPSQSPLPVQHQTSAPPAPPQYATSGPPPAQYTPTSGSPHQQFPPQFGHQPQPPPNNYRASPPIPTQLPLQWQHYQQHLPPPPPHNYYPNQTPQQAAPRPFPARPELPQPEQKQYNSPYNTGFNRMPDVKATPLPKPQLHKPLPTTPAVPPVIKTGKLTLWKAAVSPATPGPPSVAQKDYFPESPALEPLSPPLPTITVPHKSTKKDSTPVIVHSHTRSRGATPASPKSAALWKIKQETSAQLLKLRDVPSADPSMPPPRISATPTPSAGETTSDDFAVPASRKRKRSPELQPSQPPTHVLWTRNFPKISGSAIERIGAHRSASTFAKPIKDSDAPGYKNAILRPQDLKSIKAAITAGNRAGLAAIAAMDTEVDKSATSVLLPISEDLVPPRGIVNNAQLEKELMRMFANAVMFNPGPERGFARLLRSGRRYGREESEEMDVDEDGVVRDARGMCKDVEVIVGELRSAEQRRSVEMGRQRTESVSVDETADEGGGKKRKRGL